MQIDFRRFGRGLVGNVSGQSASFLAQLAVQLVSVPVFTLSWGIERYGIWLILYTLPAYLATLSLGFGGAAGNDMVAAVAQGRRHDAARTYAAVRSGFAGLSLVAALIGAALIFGPAARLLDFAQPYAHGQAQWAAMALVAYGLANLQMSNWALALRATDGFARFLYLASITAMVEMAIALALVLAGGGLVMAAVGLAVGRCAGWLATGLMIHRHAPWLAQSGWAFSMGEARRLARPALAMAMVPLGFAIQLQGTIMALGMAAGPAAVPVFTTVRTLARFAIQLTSVVNVASMPVFTHAAAQDDTARKADLVALNLTTALVVLLPAAMAIALAGPAVIRIWTGGAIIAPAALVAVMAASLVFGGLWLVLANLVLALNQHGRYSYAFVGLACVSVGACAVLARSMGALGAGITAAGFDMAMLVMLVWQARRAGILAAGSFSTAPRRSWTLIADRLPRLFRR
ncbi:hypothetical protein GRI44_11530 [Altererythrobacter confluentis]|uniref:Membrane protein involved in the export of O-antigen and teichoic acid n=1 Tax=Allopontixanthobacter confluentis TaxID=1849021 RepID=A0A6L7GII9_9SPHN|nr:hypothetical protein [Allopontixanthobacter confluentis]MXP15380.1 hypothetical protein [Allopontixanthobacter confluentis]